MNEFQKKNFDILSKISFYDKTKSDLIGVVVENFDAKGVYTFNNTPSYVWLETDYNMFQKIDFEKYKRKNATTFEIQKSNIVNRDESKFILMNSNNIDKFKDSLDRFKKYNYRNRLCMDGIYAESQNGNYDNVLVYQGSYVSNKKNIKVDKPFVAKVLGVRNYTSHNKLGNKIESNLYCNAIKKSVDSNGKEFEEAISIKEGTSVIIPNYTIEKIDIDFLNNKMKSLYGIPKLDYDSNKSIGVNYFNYVMNIIKIEDIESQTLNNRFNIKRDDLIFKEWRKGDEDLLKHYIEKEDGWMIAHNFARKTKYFEKLERLGIIPKNSLQNDDLWKATSSEVKQLTTLYKNIIDNKLDVRTDADSMKDYGLNETKINGIKTFDIKDVIAYTKEQIDNSQSSGQIEQIEMEM